MIPRRSGDFEDGMTIVTSYPFAAPTIDSPIPVLPEVGSTIRSPGWRSPARSAARTMNSAARSLAEPPGFFDSSFAATVAPSGAETCTRGDPSVSRMLASIARW